MFFLHYTIILFSLIVSTLTNRTLTKRDQPASNEPRVFATFVENLGCLDTNEKWYHPKYRPVNLEPLDRHTIRTEFLLFKMVCTCDTHEEEIVFSTITNQNADSAKVAGYKDGSCLKLMIHDFTANGHAGWVRHMAKAFLEVNPCNVVSVNWESGAQPPFDRAVANARVVAMEIFAFIKMLEANFHLDIKHEVQLVGHGIGAHIAGYVGKYFDKTLPKITGLDPTGPRFEHMPSLVRLDAEDAKFVEVLHTDAYNARSQGTMQPLGRADYYLNNAAHQPGCNDTWGLPKFTDITRDVLQEGKILPACSHKRAYKYYISAALNRDCPFIGIPCDSYEKFVNGSCTDCKKNQCLIMRYDSFSSDIPKNTKVYLNTNSEPPFCMHTYEIAISLEKHDTKRSLIGYFEFILVDENNKVSFAAPSIDGSMKRKFMPGYVHNTIAYAPPPEIDKIKEAKVKWQNANKLKLNSKPIFVKYITVMRISEKMNAPVNGLCPEIGSQIKSGDYIHFNKCDVSKLKVGELIAGAAGSAHGPGSAAGTGSRNIANVNGTGNASGNETGNATGNETGCGTGNGTGNGSGNKSGPSVGNEIGHGAGNETENQAGKNTGNESEHGSGNEAENQAGKNKGNESEHGSGNEAENQAGKNKGNESEHGSGNEAENQAGKNKGNESEHGSGNEAENQAGKNKGKESEHGSGNEAENQAGKNNGNESEHRSGNEPGNEKQNHSDLSDSNESATTIAGEAKDLTETTINNSNHHSTENTSNPAEGTTNTEELPECDDVQP